MHVFTTIDGGKIGTFDSYDVGVVYCHSVGITNYCCNYEETAEHVVLSVPKYYAGIGSRRTPTDTLAKMTLIAAQLEEQGYILRSGGAGGADTAFESGVQSLENKEIYLPWPMFNNHPSARHGVSLDAYTMAESFHPNWPACSHAAKKFHGRNCYQVLGVTLDKPVDFIMCWTPDGKVAGGTGQALRIALSNDIPIINFFHNDWNEQLHDLLETLE